MLADFVHNSCFLQAENVLGVSESDMINYHSVFADSGNSGAQVGDFIPFLSYTLTSPTGSVVTTRNVLHVRNGWSRKRFPGKLVTKIQCNHYSTGLVRWH